MMDTSRDEACRHDAADPLRSYRDRFYTQPGTIYLDGNSLGLLSHDAERTLLRVLTEWKTQGIEAWLHADPPWFTLTEELGALMAPLVGAEPDEVIVTASTTVNLHTLVATFYQPTRERRKIIASSLDFPSDIYALQSQIRLHGGDPARDLVIVQSRDGRLIEEDDIIAAMTPDVAMVILPAVYYRSGQLLDIARLTSAAHELGILIGIDGCHSVGLVPHEFSRWNVDFAFWCTYKYLNSGPGGTAGLYVNRRHFGTAPGMAGWWGSDKTTQFDMSHTFTGAENAGSWQIGTPPLLSTAPLHGSLMMFAEAGIATIRAASLARTDYLIALIEAMGLTNAPYQYGIGTPRDHARRGGHVAVEHAEGTRIAKALKTKGVIPDFRPPNIIRLAPIALYTSYDECWQAAHHLKAIIDERAYEAFPSGRDLVA
ncbi:MAG: kynureninase [Chloroflexota bacterium]|nr:kynureninase [Chloroflexota bacterium]